MEKVDLTKKLDKKDYDEQLEILTSKLARLQRESRDLGIPVMIVFEGAGASGKGVMINQLIQPLDPRGFNVYAINGESSEEQLRPFLWRFWTKTPAKGRMAIFDRSWYMRVLTERFDGKVTDEQLVKAFDEINMFERQLTDDGTVIIKLFLHISKKEQKRRFEKLLENKETAWRVTKQDLKRNKKYDDYMHMNDEMLQKTDNDYSEWNIIEATDKRFAKIKMMQIVANILEIKTEKFKSDKETFDKRINKPMEISKGFKTSALNTADLTFTLDRDIYKKRLDDLQSKINVLHSELYRKRIPVIIAFEGWDAGGKGGAIKRLTQKLDPRGYTVNPTASPNDIEKAHHYLWRFWNKVPKAGHIAIFDRTWYGRVMVERIEGFCTENEWHRAYNEINQMEEQFANFGAIVLKFWMHIDKVEQERRFKERQNDPDKQWKITEEDWRNREKWNLYEVAVDEMLVRTSTTYAPWTIVEANNKYYARIKVLETVVKTLEERLK